MQKTERRLRDAGSPPVTQRAHSENPGTRGKGRRTEGMAEETMANTPQCDEKEDLMFT